MVLRYFLEQFTVLFFALAAAGLVLDALTHFYKIMVLQLLLAFAAQIGGIVLQMESPGKSNEWLFNIYIIADTAVLLYAGVPALGTFKAKVVVFAAFALFLAAWLIEVLGAGITLFANKAYVIACSSVILLYLVVLYRHITANSQKVYASPAFWICSGLVLSYGCSIPYFGLLHFFQKANAGLNKLLYEAVVVTLQNVQYLFFGIAFLLYRRDKPNPISNT